MHTAKINKQITHTKIVTQLYKTVIVFLLLALPVLTPSQRLYSVITLVVPELLSSNCLEEGVIGEQQPL